MWAVDLARVPHLRPPVYPESAAYSDPEVVRASEWLQRFPDDPGALLIGVPFAGGSISNARTELAPSAVRRVFSRFTVWSSDVEISLDGFPIMDAGDLETEEAVDTTQRRIEEVIAAIIEQAPVPVVALGGDNSVTVGLARGAGADALVTFDAHHDCRDPALRVTNGSPVRQLIEGGLKHVVQIGIHGFANSETHALWAREHGVIVRSASAVRQEGIDTVVAGALASLPPAGRVWVDFDLDCLERAFAPGAPAALPGGLSPHDLERAAYLLGRDSRVVGMDLVELDPEADVADTTARAACASALAFLAGVSTRR